MSPHPLYVESKLYVYGGMLKRKARRESTRQKVRGRSWTVHRDFAQGPFPLRKSYEDRGRGGGRPFQY